MRVRRLATFRVLYPRTRVITTSVTLTLPSIREDGAFVPAHFDVGELLTVLHQAPAHRSVTSVITRDNFLTGGWDVLDASTNEPIARVNLS